MTLAVFHFNVTRVIQYWFVGLYSAVTPSVTVMDIRGKYWNNETADSKSQLAFVRRNKCVVICI